MSNTNASAEATRPVYGNTAGPEFFQVKEFEELDGSAILDVLEGRLAGAIFRNQINPEVSKRLIDAFWDSVELKKRGEEAPGRYLGTYHYLKEPKQYLDECDAIFDVIAEFEALEGNPSRLFFDALAATVKDDGVTIRNAEHEGRKMCSSLIRSWMNVGNHSLAPHDDEAQVTWPGQSKLEFQKATGFEVCAFNACIENGGGGDLIYWNVRPSAECRRELGLEFTGSPYSVEQLEPFEFLTIPINAGDVYIFNGAYVHAVASLNDSQKHRRTTMSCLCGFIDEKTIVRWS